MFIVDVRGQINLARVGRQIGKMKHSSLERERERYIYIYIYIYI